MNAELYKDVLVELVSVLHVLYGVLILILDILCASYWYLHMTHVVWCCINYDVSYLFLILYYASWLLMIYFLYITHCLMHHVFEAKSPEAMAKPEDHPFFCENLGECFPI